MTDENRVSVVGSSNSLPNTNDINDLLGTLVTRKEIQSRSKGWNNFDKLIENGISKVRYSKVHVLSPIFSYTFINGITRLNQHFTRWPIYKSITKSACEE